MAGICPHCENMVSNVKGSSKNTKILSTSSCKMLGWRYNADYEQYNIY